MRLRRIVLPAGALVAFLLIVWPGWALGNPIWDEFGNGGEEQAAAQPTATVVAQATATPAGAATAIPRATTPSATATPATGAVPNPFAQGTGGVCRLDKVGTWSEGNNPHRIEVGGHGGQHFDFYPQYQPRIYAISYIVNRIANPDGVPDIAWGYGSLWEGDTPECASFDWAADASRYARARLDSGHSGLVIDLRSNPPRVVTNLRNLSQADIVALLAVHSAAMRKGERGFEIAIPQLAFAAPPPQASAPAPVAPVAPPAPPAPAPVAPQQASAPAAASAPPPPAPPVQACNPTISKVDSARNFDVSGPAVVTVWTNRGPQRNEQKLKLPSWGQAEQKVLIASGETWKFLDSAGTVNKYPAGCNPSAEFNQIGLPARSWDEMHAADMVG